MNLPEPRFRVGQKVRVILNERNRTPREGTVDQVWWHYKLNRHMYFLRVPGKTVPTRAVSKRYFDDDLLALEP